MGKTPYAPLIYLAQKLRKMSGEPIGIARSFKQENLPHPGKRNHTGYRNSFFSQKPYVKFPKTALRPRAELRVA